MGFGKKFALAIESYLNGIEKTQHALIILRFSPSLAVRLATFLIDMYDSEVNHSAFLVIPSEYSEEYIKGIEEWLDLFEGLLWTAVFDNTTHTEDNLAIWKVTRI